MEAVCCTAKGQGRAFRADFNRQPGPGDVEWSGLAGLCVRA